MSIHMHDNHTSSSLQGWGVGGMLQGLPLDALLGQLLIYLSVVAGLPSESKALEPRPPGSARSSNSTWYAVSAHRAPIFILRTLIPQTTFSPACVTPKTLSHSP